jgi:hypothetical protein
MSVITTGWTVEGKAYDNTLEKSAEGDMTKLSADEDHEIRCCMLESSSMLLPSSVTVAPFQGHPPQPNVGWAGQSEILTCIACE